MDKQPRAVQDMGDATDSLNLNSGSTEKTSSDGNDVEVGHVESESRDQFVINRLAVPAARRDTVGSAASRRDSAASEKSTSGESGRSRFKSVGFSDRVEERGLRRESTSLASDITEVWDPLGSTGLEEGAPLLPKSPNGRGNSIWGHTSQASKTPPLLRPFFLALAFTTVVFVWESLDHLVVDTFKMAERRLIAYFVLAVVAKVLVYVSHELAKLFSRKEWNTIEVSYFYALSTILLAVSVWGILTTSVSMLVPKKSVHFAWMAGSVVCLSGTMAHGIWTRHNYMMEVGGCLLLLTSVYEQDDSGFMVNKILDEVDSMSPQDRDLLIRQLMRMRSTDEGRFS